MCRRSFEPIRFIANCAGHEMCICVPLQPGEVLSDQMRSNRCGGSDGLEGFTLSMQNKSSIILLRRADRHSDWSILLRSRAPANHRLKAAPVLLSWNMCRQRHKSANWMRTAAKCKTWGEMRLAGRAAACIIGDHLATATRPTDLNIHVKRPR